MKTLRELIAQLPPDSQKRIEEMTQKLIEEEAAARKSREDRDNRIQRHHRRPYSFFETALNMNLDSPPDMSTRLHDYLCGEPCDARSDYDRVRPDTLENH